MGRCDIIREVRRGCSYRRSFKMRSEGCAGINKAKGKLEACLSNGSNMFQLPIAEERVKSVRD